MKQFTVTELKSFSEQHRTTITDIYIEGVIEHNGKKGVVSIELNESGELIGLAYNVTDRRKLKFTNLSVQGQRVEIQFLFIGRSLKVGKEQLQQKSCLRCH